MSSPATSPLLHRLATAFAVSFATMTVPLLANHAVRYASRASGRGVTVAGIAESVLLAVPFTAAITIPMAVFVAVLWVFTRLGATGALTTTRQRDGLRRLLTPVLGGAAAVAMLTLASNSQLVPRANARLLTLDSGRSPARSDRTMTIPELRTAARSARADAAPDARSRAASLEVEIHKKVALAASCLVLALAAAALALRFPRGGTALVIGASLASFGAYYVLLIVGETLADRQVVSPFVAMWMANALFLLLALLAGRGRAPRAPSGVAPLAIGR